MPQAKLRTGARTASARSKVSARKPQVNTRAQPLPDPEPILVILVRAATRLCALPLGHVIETMRLLPIEPVADAPAGVLGLSIIRGAPVPVVDLAALVGASEAPTRLILLRVGARTVALAVAELIGVRRLDADRLEATPPLLQLARAELIESIGILDAQLVVVLRAARLLPEES
jgi:purine-binding chemotaxis protein CheW